ncbi:MAG TPA: LamG domain-containing protein, partial [Candidatus Polarisedimenticolia bacterium]|nr:LamG domain-containing protein [Candidatus Polarisedimenticolia bacterium]
NALDAVGIEIQRSTDGTNFVLITDVQPNSTSYSDGGLAPMTAYYYRILDYTYTDDSSFTPVAEASTKWSGAPPLLGMIAWWPAENSADDVIGNNNGTTPYGIAYAPGKSGRAFDFDGANSRVFIPDNPNLVLTNLTLEGWFYARQTLDSYIAMRGDDRGALDSWVIRRMSDGQLAFQIGDMLKNFVTIETPVPNNQWTHFAATFDSTNGRMKLYINGMLAVQTNTTLHLIGAYDPGWDPGVGIGSQSGTLTVRPSFDGLIDDVALYSRALTPAEIQSIYSAGPAGKAGLSITPTSAPVLSLQSPSGGVMQLTIDGIAGRAYEIDVSTDLVNWTTWTQMDSTGTNSVIDTNGTAHPQRFYRVRLLP